MVNPTSDNQPLQYYGASAGGSFNPEALGIKADPLEVVPATLPKAAGRLGNLWIRRSLLGLLGLALTVGLFWVLVGSTKRHVNNSLNQDTSSQYSTTSIPLGPLATNGSLDALTQAQTVAINGSLELNGALVVSPSLQPASAQKGQIYYDKNSNQLAYYNGAGFVNLGAGVQSLGGLTGQITAGGGLVAVGGQLSNSGVLSVQGLSGNVTLTAGNGVGVNGTTISNTGVISVVAGSPSVSVTNDGSGHVTVDLVGGGTGTINSPGGTAGKLAKFTAAQTIADSLINDNGTTVTVAGDLSVTGGVTLSNALTVANGGTGTTTLTANGVVVGQGAGALTAVTAAGPGLCFLSTGGAPAFAACPSASGVTSLNGLTGALSIANATGAGATVTINNASTAAKGIAQFNATNFSDNGAGTINTIQNINSGATPTFAGVNTNTITPSAPLTVGISAQTALLQGSTTTITSSGAGNNIVLNSANTIELQSPTNVTGNASVSGTLAANGGNITSSGALNITPGGTLTVGASSQTLTLQGGASTTFKATSGANSTIVAFASPTANTTLNFPALSAGTYTICTTSGNCAGAGVTLQSAYNNSSSPEIVLDATRGALTLRDNATPIGANLLEVQDNTGATTYLAVTSSGLAVTGTATISGNINSSGGSLQTGGTTRVDNGGNLTNIGSLTLSGAISGGTSFSGSGNINTTGGVIQTNSTTRLDNSGNLVNIAAITATGNGTLQGGTLTLGTNVQAGTVVFNDGSTNTGSLTVAPLGQNTVYTLPDPGAGTATICLTSGNCTGVGGGVTTAGGTTNTVPKFTAPQSIGDSIITDNGSTVTIGGTLGVNTITPTGAFTAGAVGQTATLRGSTTTITSNGAGNNIVLNAANTIELQSSTNVTGNLDVSGTLTAGTANAFQVDASGNVTAGTYNSNTFTSSSLQFGAAATAAIQSAGGQALNITGNAASTWSTSTGNLTVQAASSLNLKATSGNVVIGTSDTTGTLLVVDTKTSAGDPAGSDGAIYYNSNSGNFRCFQGGVWTNCITASGGFVSLQNAYDNGNSISTDGSGDIAFTLNNQNFTIATAAGASGATTFSLTDGSNPSAPSQLVLITNNDVNEALATGLAITSAAGGITTGLDVSDADITNAISVGDNVILGAAATIDFTSFDVTSGGDITANNATLQGGNVSIGTTSQAGVLALSDGSSNTGSVQTAALGQDTVYTLPDPGSGTVNICLSTGNCAGAGGGVTGSGTNDRIVKFTSTGSTVGNSTISDNGTTVTTSVDLTIQGGDLTVGVANSQVGTINVADGGSAFSGSITQGSLTGNHTYTLPDSTGTFCLTSGNCLGGGGGGANTALSNLSSVAINTTLLPGSTTIDLGSGAKPFRDLYLGGTATNNFKFTGTASAARTYTLDDLSGRIALVQTAGGSSAQTGDINVSGALLSGTATVAGAINSSGGAIQTAGTDRISNGGNLVNIGTITTSGAINSQTISSAANFTGTLTVQGASITSGTTSQQGSLVLHDGNGQTATLSVGSALVANTAIVIPTAVGASDTVCLLTLANCLGAGGGANSSLSNLSSVAINTSLLPGSTTIDLGSNAKPFRDLYLGGTATNNFQFTGTASAARTYTLDDLSGRIALVQTAGSSSAQTGDINASGTLIAGTALQGTLVKTADGAGASSGITLRSGTTTGGSGLSTGTVTIASGDGSGTNTSSGNVSVDSGAKTGSGTNGSVAIGGTNASAVNIGRSGVTTTNNGALSVTQGLTANGGATIAANQNLTLASGIGVLGQTYANGSAGSAQTLSVTNSNAGGSAVAVNGQDITLVGTATSGGINSNSAVKFEDPTAQANNNFYGLNFAGTGYTDVLRVNGTQIISGAGKVQNAAIDSAVTYSNLTKVGTLTTGALGAGFTTVAVAQGGTGATSFTSNGVLYGNNTGAIQATAAGTTGQCLIGNTGAAPTWVTCTGLVTLQNAYNNSSDPEITLGSASTAGLSLRDNATPISGNLFEVQSNNGATTYFGVTASGVSVTGTTTSSGNINSSSGTIQTAGTDRISNGGNLVNIGTITTSGAINSQTISSAANFTGTLTVQGASITSGTTSQQGSLVLHDGNGQTATLSVGSALVANTAIAIPTAVGTTDTVCLLTLANCLGGAGGGANTALSNLTGVAINTSLLPGTTTIDLGSNAKPFQDLFLGGTATNNFRFTGTATAARTYTLDDLSGRIALVQTAGSSSAQTGDINASGTLIAGTALQGTLFKSADGAGASSAVTFRSGTTTGGSGLSTGAVTIASGDGSGTNTSSGNVSIDSGAKSGSGTTGSVTVGGTNASAITLGHNGITTTNSGALTVSQALTANGGATVAANQNLTLSNGTGVLGQTFTNSAASSAQTLSVTNSNAGGSSIAVNAHDITLVGTATSGGINSNSAIKFEDPTAQANNNFYGLNFAGTGYTDVLRVNGTQIISGAGKIQNAAIDSAVTYSNLTKVGTLTTGALGSGFTTVAVAQGGTGATSFTSNGVLYGNNTGAIQATAAGTTGQCLVGNTSAAPSWVTCNTLVTLQNAYNNSSDPEITLGNGATKGLSILDNATPISGNLLEVQNNARTTTYLGVTSSAVTLGSGVNLLLTGPGAYISNPQTGSNNTEAFGLNASVSNGSQFATAVGNGATTSTGGTAIGASSSVTNSGVALGTGAISDGDGSIALGFNSRNVSNNASIAIGTDAFNTAANQLVIGSDSHEISQAIIGNGFSSAAPVSLTLQGTAGFGNNVAGANLTFAGGQSTGNVGGGSLSFQTSAAGGFGSSLNSLSTVFSLAGGTGAALFQNATDSSTAFRIQNAAGSTTALSVDTTSTNAITLGAHLLASDVATGTTGTTSGTGSNTTTLTLTADAFNVNDVVFIDNAGQDFYTRITVDPGTGSYTVSPAVTFENARTVTKYTVQNVGATASDYTTQANRFFQGYFLGGVVTGAGSTTLSDQRLNSTGGLNFNATGYVFQNSSDTSTSFKVMNAAGSTTALSVDTTGGTGVTIGGTLTAVGPSSQTYTGTSDASVLTLANASGTQTNGFLVNRNAGGGTTTNGINVTQTAGTLTNGLSFTGTIGTDINRSSGTLSLQGAGGVTITAGTTNTASIDSAGAGTVALGAANATTINIASSAPAAARSTTIGGGNAGFVDTINIGTGAGTVAGAKTIHIGDGTPTGSGTNLITIGSIAALANTTTVQGGNGSGAVSIQAAASGTISIGTTNSNPVTIGSTGSTNNITVGQSTDTQTIAIGNAATAAGKIQTINIGTGSTSTGKDVITIGSTNDGSSLLLQAGIGNLALQTNSSSASIIIKDATGSATAFQVQDAGGAGMITTNSVTRSSGTAGNTIKIGDSTGTDTDTTVLILDGTTANPTTNLSSLSGGLFYNSTTNKVSLVENGVVKIICNTTDLGCGTGTITLQTAYANGNTISTTGNDVAFTLNTSQSFTTATASGNTAGGVTFTSGNTSGTQTNGLLISRNGASGTTTNGINVTQTAGTLTNGLAFTGTIGTDITRASGTLTVQGAGGINLTSSSGNITIGTSDTTGTLLVLDTKTDYTNHSNSSSEPTGVAGGMYYNSALGQFRCYEIDHWRDCLASARSSYYYTNDLTSTMTSNFSDGVLIDFGSGTGADVIQPTPAGTVGHPGIAEMTTGTTGTGASGIDAVQSDQVYRLGNNDYWRYESSVRVPVLSTSGQTFVIYSGFRSGTATSSDTVVDQCAFRYSSTVALGNGKWQGICAGAGGSASTCDSGITLTANQWYRLTITVNAAGNSVNFQVDGSTTNGTGQCQVTTNIPTTSGHEVSIHNDLAKTNGTTEVAVDLDYVEVNGQFGSSR